MKFTHDYLKPDEKRIYNLNNDFLSRCIQMRLTYGDRLPQASEFIQYFEKQKETLETIAGVRMNVDLWENRRWEVVDPLAEVACPQCEAVNDIQPHGSVQENGTDYFLLQCLDCGYEFHDHIPFKPEQLMMWLKMAEEVLNHAGEVPLPEMKLKKEDLPRLMKGVSFEMKKDEERKQILIRLEENIAPLIPQLLKYFEENVELMDQWTKGIAKG